MIMKHHGKDKVIKTLLLEYTRHIIHYLPTLAKPC